MKWFFFRSKDRKVQGYCLAKDRRGVARFAGYPLRDLVIKPVRWNGKMFAEIKR